MCFKFDIGDEVYYVKFGYILYGSKGIILAFQYNTESLELHIEIKNSITNEIHTVLDCNVAKNKIEFYELMRDFSCEMADEDINEMFENFDFMYKDNNKFDNILFKPIESFNLSPRTITCLNAENINCLKKITDYSKRDLLRIPNFGKKSLNEIINLLSLHGLELKK